jgi:RNA-directed DNA polymerase
VRVGKEVLNIVKKHSFSIAEAKTRMSHYSERQMVTGLVVNVSPNVPRKYVRSVRNLLYIWRQHGPEAAIGSMKQNGGNVMRNRRSHDYLLVVRGRVQHIGFVKGWQSGGRVPLLVEIV